MKARYWSLAIILILINYLIFSSLFIRLLNSDYGADSFATRTPIPTFTPAPAEPLFNIPTVTPVPVVPTPTATRVIPQSGADVSGAAAVGDANAARPETNPDNEPYLVAPGAVNIRSGPGINYPVIGTLNAEIRMPIIGRNGPASWWQIKIADGSVGWVANSVVQAANTENVPVVDIPDPPVAEAAAQTAPEAAEEPPPAPEQPKFQYEPTGWYDDGNAGLTRFLGDIVDVNGSPVNGVFVQAKCGDYSTVSMPSGPVGWGPLNESADWPAGFYDIVVDTKPVPCVWTLTVVDTEDRKTIKAFLSESIPLQLTSDKSIVTANWRKNW